MSLSIISFAMRLSFQHKLDRYLGPPICRVLTWYSRLRKPVAKLPKNPTIIVILLSEMGSLVLAHPLFCKLKSMWPRANRYAVVFERNREALGLMDLIPPENILTIDDRTFRSFAADSIRALKQMRGIGIDLAIDAELFTRISSIFSFLSGAALRVGFHPHTQEGLYRGDFINRPVLYNPYQHFSKQLLSMADAVTSTATPKIKTRAPELPPAPPPIPVEADDIERMRHRLTTDFPALSDRRLVLLHPGGGVLPLRAWPPDCYTQVAGQLVRSGFAAGIIGLASDGPLATQIVRSCQDAACIDLTGYTHTVKELIHLLHLSELLITNDGGSGHLAALTPITTIMLFGPETPRIYRPLGKKTVVLYEPIACSPCLTAYNHRRSPCDGENICLRRISSAKVLEKALTLLNQRAV